MAITGEASNIVFRGTDGTECEEFIAAIEEFAFTKGWSEDKKRMLLFARSRLRQKAVRWFAQLDPSIQDDWGLFVKALFNQYPPVEQPPETEIATPVWSATTFSPSASTAILPEGQDLDSQPTAIADERRSAAGDRSRHNALPRVRMSIPGRQIGILRIVVEDGTTNPQYVWRGPPPISPRGGSVVQLDTTIDRQEALTVCFIPSSEPHPIGCLNATSKLGDLSLYFKFPAVLYPLHIINGVVAANPNSGYFSNIWNVLPDGSLEASLCAWDLSSHDGYMYTKTERFKTTEVHLDTSGSSVCFVKPCTPLWQDDPKRNTTLSRYEINARIVFEPL